MADRTRWLPVAEAARVLGVTERAVRRRIKRETLETRTERVGNRSRTLVRVSVQDVGTGQEPGRGPGPGPDAREVELAVLQVTVAELRERVAAAEAERDRLLALVERLTAERLPPSRRPWPGLQSWWQWLWTGESGG